MEEDLIKFVDSHGRLKQIHPRGHGYLKPLAHGMSHGVNNVEPGSEYTRTFPNLSRKAGDGQPKKPD